MLYKLTEWSGGGSQWYCGCVDDLARDSGHWIYPARVLGLEPAAYIEWAIDFCHPNIHYNAEKCLVHFSWDKQVDMRKYKNYINKIAREKNFQI